MAKIEFAPGEIIEVLKRAGHEPSRKAGNDKYMYLCVFHADGRNANMSVDAKKNVYHCFACPAEGGVIDLARELRVEYRTADGRSHQPTDESSRGRGRPSNDDMWKEWASALWTEDGTEALALLRARGLEADILRAHGIGVSHRLFTNEVGGDWRITIPIFDEKGTLLFLRRHHPQGKLRAWLQHVVMVDDPSRYSDIKGKKDEQTADCPACNAELRVSPAQAETEIACPACAVKLRVNARTVKMWGGAHAAIYGLQILAEMRKAAQEDPKAKHRVVIVGGEWDRLMMLQAGIPAVTCTHGENTWKAEWTPLFNGLDVVVMYDADKPGQDGAGKVARSMQELSLCASLKVVQLPFREDDRLPNGKIPKDANDWFLMGRSADEMLAAIDVTEPLALSFRSGAGPRGGGVSGTPGAGGGGGGGKQRPPCDLIDDVRDLGKEVSAYRKRRMIWEIVRQTLATRGRFMRTKEKNYYYFDGERRRLHIVCNEEMVAFINTIFRLNPTENEFKYVVGEMETEAIERGELVRVRRFVHWVKETNLLYLSQFNGTVVRISDSGTETVANGTDGVVFLDQEDGSEPWSFAVAPKDMPIGEAVAEIMRYVGDISFDEAKCPPEIAQKLLLLWILSVFFGGGIKTRPICTFVGPRGSGKTLAFQRFLQLCFGLDAEVTSVRHDNQDDMQAAVMSSILVIFDNVDNDAEFMNDELAKIATGMKIVRRRLYSTLASETFRPDCFVGITTQAPHFTRTDVIDRMLLFRVARRGGDGFEFGIVPTITATDRSRFFSAVACIAMRVLAAYRDGKRPTKSPYRLADWSTMAFAIGVAIEWPVDEMEAIISAAEWMRTELLAEEDPIVDLITRWLAESDMREGQWYHGAQIVTEWNTILEKERSKIRYHAKWVIRKIKDALPALQKRWSVDFKFDENHFEIVRFHKLEADDLRQSDLASYMAQAAKDSVLHGKPPGGREPGDDSADEAAAAQAAQAGAGGGEAGGATGAGAPEEPLESFDDDDDAK